MHVYVYVLYVSETGEEEMLYVEVCITTSVNVEWTVMQPPNKPTDSFCVQEHKLANHIKAKFFTYTSTYLHSGFLIALLYRI
jgi:hypothetical protein